MSALRRLRRIRPWWRRFRGNGYRPDRCAHCGHGFHWTHDARHGTGNRDGLHYHGPCLAYIDWRRRAENRLAVLAVVAELTGVTAKDVQGAMSLRDGEDGWNLAWRVFYDLGKAS